MFGLRARGLIFVAVVIFSFAAFPASAQTTGTISGIVTDRSKVPLAEAVLEISSPNLQGRRIAVTEKDGRFRFPLLPPGTYAVTAELGGFETRQQGNVVVGLDRVVTVDVELAPKVRAEIVVSSDTLGVETAGTNIGESLDKKVFQNLPTARNYASVAQLVGGTSTDDADLRNTAVTVYGSTGLENAFLVDGVNTTGVEFGSQGKILNFEFIQEVEMKTGGYEAEYGHATGGIVNVVTKSGGNEFHGDVFAYLDNDSLQADNEHEGEVVGAGVQTGFKRSDFGFDVGGFIMKDRLWFFGAYDRVDNSRDTRVTAGPVSGTIANLKTTRDTFAGKLTGKVSDKHTLVLTLFGDPEDNDGAVNPTIVGPPSTYEGKSAYGGTDYSLRYEGILGPKLILEAQGARHREEFDVTPGSGANTIRVIDNRNDVVTTTGGYGRIDSNTFTRQDYKLDGTFFLGGHSVKVGVEYEKMDADVSRFFSGGQQVTILSPLPGQSRPVYQHYYWTSDTAALPNAPSVVFTAAPNHKQLSFFAQDRWAVLPNLTVNAGLRYEKQDITSKFGEKAFSVDQIAPRIGVSWDFLKDGKTKAFGSYGQFVESIPMDMNIRSFSAERNPTIYNFSPTSLVPDAGAESDTTHSTILGGYTEPVDPDLKPQYLDEFIVGAEREVAPGTVLGIRYIYRRLGRVIEDGFIASAGDYFIMNPGEGTLGSSYPKARRHFRGLELTAQKRVGGNFQFFATYLFSNLEGNYDGAFKASTGQRDPNINADFDYPEFLVNNDGPLSLDRRHQFKIQGTYVAPFRLVASLSFTYRSGAPRSRFGWFDNYGRPELYLTTRGEEGRTDSLSEADLHLGYPIKAGPVEINILLDVFSLLNQQEAITVDNRYAFNQSDNENATPSNSRYGKGVTFQDPRTLRLGLRVSF